MLDVSKVEEVRVVRIFNVYFMTELQCSIRSVVYFFFLQEIGNDPKRKQTFKKPRPNVLFKKDGEGRSNDKLPIQ